MPIQDYFRMKQIFGDDNNMPGMGIDFKNPNQPQNFFANQPPLASNAASVDNNPNATSPGPGGVVDSSPMGDSRFTPQTRDSEALRQLISQYPSRDDYQPTTLRRVGSTFAGLQGGMKAQEDYLNAPYNEKVQDWKNRIAPAEQAANLERYGNANERMLGYQSGRLGVQQDAEARRQSQGDWKLSQGDVRNDQLQQKIDQAQQRIDQNQEKINHVNQRQDISDSEKLALTNRYKQEQIKAKADADMARQNLIGSQRVTQINTKGDVDKDLQEMRGSQAVTTAETRGAEARKTKSTAPGGGAQGNLPSQQKVSLQNKAAQGIRENPDWAKWMTVDDQGQVRIQSPGRFSGPDQKTYDAMVQYIEQGQNVVDLGTRNATKPPDTSEGAGPTGKVRVRAPDGKTGTWDYSKGPLPKGFVVLQ